MHLAFDLLTKSLDGLSNIHPFFGIGFLVCKKAKLPVGKSIPFAFGNEEREFLQVYYKPDVRSEHFFLPFGKPRGRWVAAKYPFAGSQSTRTRGDLQPAFLHKKGTEIWGWSPNYVRVLKSKLDRDKSGRVPAFWLAVWLYRERDWPRSTSAGDIVQAFLTEFNITPEERDELLRTSIPDFPPPLLDEVSYSDSRLLKEIESAPDAKPEEGGTLKLLELHGVGPTKLLRFEPAERLSIITGDNGLGKTFLLECAWWSLTGQWAERAASPRSDAAKSEPRISFEIAAKERHSKVTTIPYDWQNHSWPAPKDRPTIPGLIVYARVDGSFAVWDPVRHLTNQPQEGLRPGLFLFSRDDVLDGLGSKIEGLLRDWVKWQHDPDKSTFETFQEVLRRLSPPDMNPLEPSDPVRVPHDSRAIPTLRHNYGVIPFINESAGVRRIVTIAYLLVWAWTEHKIYSALAKKPPQEKLVVLIDEMEAHLHPKWQRVVLPALLDVTNILGKSIRPQMIISTHSPLVIASVEKEFSDESDKLLHLQLKENTEVDFKEVKFVRYGRIDAWLTSDLFELRQARSREGEQAMERAKEILEKEEPTVEEIREVTKALTDTLAADDAFWPRWVYFAERKGVEL